MEIKTQGIVTSVVKLWWLKINKKPIRMHALDGADFPRIITVEYNVSNHTYKKRKFIGNGIHCPKKGEYMEIFYQKDNPKKSRLGV